MKKIILIFQLSIIIIFQIQAQLVITGPNELCENAMGSYSVSGGTMPYIWDAGGGAIITGSPGNNVTITAGTINFTITVTDDNGSGISKIKDVIVIRKSTDPISATANPANICEGSPSVLTLNGGGGGTNGMIKWYSASCGGTLVGTGNGITVTPVVTTKYYGRYEDAAPCSTNTTCSIVEVVVQKKSSNPTSATANPTNICEGSSSVLTLNGGGGGTNGMIKWYSASCGGTLVGTGNGITVTPVVTTKYYGRYEDAAPCSTNTTCSIVEVVVQLKSSNPTSATANPANICEGSPSVLTLNGGGGGTNGMIKWYSASCGGTLVGTGNGITVTPVATTKYYGRYEDAAPCNTNSGCAEVEVTVQKKSSNPTSASVLPQEICEGSTNQVSLTLTGGGGGTNAVVKWYTNSCGTGILIGTGNPFIIPTNPTVNTIYYGRYEDSAPCSTKTICQQVELKVNKKSSNPTGASISLQAICEGSTNQVSLTLTGGGGGTNAVVKWYTNSCGTGILIGTGNPFIIPTNPTVSTIYYGRYEDPAPCSTNTICQQVELKVNKKSGNPTSASVLPQEICEGSTNQVSLTLTGGGGGTNAVVKWYTNSCGTGILIGTGNPFIIPTNPTVSTIYYGRYEDPAPCSTNTICQQVELKVNKKSGNPISAIISPQEICEGSTNQVSLTLTGGGGGTNAVVKWYTNSCGSGILIGTGNPLIIPTNPTVNTIFYGRYEDPAPCGTNTICQQVELKVIKKPTKPSNTIANPSSICINSESRFEGNCSGYQIEWFDANNMKVNSLYKFSTPGNFKFKAYCTNLMCKSDDFAEITVEVFDNPNPGQIFSMPQLDPIHVCDGATIQLKSSGVPGGFWSVSNMNFANIDAKTGILKGINQGSVNVKYTVSESHPNTTCSAETTKDVRIDENPTAVIIGDQDVCIGKDAKLQVEVKTGALPFKFLWNTNVTSNEININAVGESKTYLVTVTDNNTCSIVSTYKLNVLDTPKIVFNLSTPINNTQVIQIEDKSIPNNSIKSFELKVKNVVTKVEKIISNYDPSGKYNFANLAYGTYEVCLKIINNSMCEGYYCKNYLLQDTACYGIVQASLDRVIPKYCIGDTVKIRLHIDFNKFDFSRKFPVCQVFNNVNLIYSKEFSATIKDFDTTILILVNQPNSFNLVSSISGLDFSGISISCSDAKNFDVYNKPSLLLEDKVLCSRLDGIEILKVNFKINDDIGNISKTNPFSYKIDGGSKEVNDTFSLEQNYKTDSLQVKRCIDFTRIVNNTTGCYIDPPPECILLNKVPIFDLKDTSFCSGTKAIINLNDFTYDKSNIIFSWRAANETFKNIKQIIIDNVTEGKLSYFYKIANLNDLNCYDSSEVVISGLKRPEIRNLESLLNCSGLIKLNLKVGEISNLNDVIWSSNHSNTELIPISKDIVLVKSKSAQENIRCIINIGTCADTMNVNLSNFPVVDTSSNLINSIFCNDSTLLYTSLSKCYSWYFINSEGIVETLKDTYPYIVLNSKMLDNNKYFISTYDCISGACDTTALFHRSSSNEEHCQDFLHPNVKLYPNPNNGSFTLIVDEFPPGLYMLEVFDLLGRELYQSESVLNSKNVKLDYQLESNVASGMYFVSFGNGSGIRFTIPILITK